MPQILPEVTPCNSVPVWAWVETSNQKYCSLMLPFHGYFHAENQRIWYNIWRDIDDQRILQSDWTEAFSIIICEPEFSDIGFAWVISFILSYSKKQWQNFIKLKKNPSILDIFCSFWRKQELFQKIHFCHTYLFLDFYCCTKFQKKVMNRFWEKLVIDVWIDRPTDKQQNKFKSIWPSLLWLCLSKVY